MSKIARMILALATVLMALVFVTPAATAYNPFGSVCSDVGAGSSPTCHQNASQNGKSTDPAVNTIQTAVNIIAGVAGVAAVIVIIIAGFQFVTAGGSLSGQRSGDTNKIKSARAALTGALIGLVVIALAWTIVTFVTNHFTG